MRKPLFAFIIVLAGFAHVPGSSAVQDLVGPTSREAILEHVPAWQELVAAYQPKPEALDKLRGLGREVRIEVYFGSWCSDSMAHVSAFFKVLDLADTPLLRPVYFGVPEAKDQRARYAGGRAVVKLPTFIVFVDGREVGRIVETPRKSVEEDLVTILGLQAAGSSRSLRSPGFSAPLPGSPLAAATGVDRRIPAAEGDGRERNPRSEPAEAGLRVASPDLISGS